LDPVTHSSSQKSFLSIRRQLLPKLALLSVPVLGFYAWQFSLPLNQYNFRLWEALSAQNMIGDAPFYPNQHLEMNEVGGTAPYTSSAVLQKTSWTTDEFGNRNLKEACLEPQVMVIGDSMTIGAGVDENEMLSAQLSRKLNHCVRSFAGGKLGHQLERALQRGIHPNYIVLTVAEYSATDLVELNQFKVTPPDKLGSVFAHPRISSLGTLWSRFRKNSFWNYRSVHGIWAALLRPFLSTSETDALLSHDPRTPHFMFELARDGRATTPAQVAVLVKSLNLYAEKLATTQIKLIVSIVPQKEEVYSDLTQNDFSPFSKIWNEQTQNQNFVYVDQFKLMRDAYQKNHQYLHRLDDNHWNARGIELFTNELAKFLK
jgi:alginate O-acetyltransferase complex protein AlgJ